MIDKKPTGFENIEESLKKLGENTPSNKIDAAFSQELKSKLRDDFLLKGESEEKTIIDKLIEGLSAWSKMPIWSAIGASVAVILIVLNFGPKKIVEEMKVNQQEQMAQNTVEDSYTDADLSETSQPEASKVKRNTNNKVANNIPTQTQRAETTVAPMAPQEASTMPAQADYANTADEAPAMPTDTADTSDTAEGDTQMMMSLKQTETIYELEINIAGDIYQEVTKLEEALNAVADSRYTETSILSETSANIELRIDVSNKDSVVAILRKYAINGEVSGESSLNSANNNELKIHINVRSE